MRERIFRSSDKRMISGKISNALRYLETREGQALSLKDNIKKIVSGKSTLNPPNYQNRYIVEDAYDNTRSALTN